MVCFSSNTPYSNIEEEVYRVVQLEQLPFKNVLINKMFGLTYARFLYETFKPLVPGMEFASLSQILNFHGQCKEKVIWEPGVTVNCTNYLLYSFFSNSG